MEEKSKNMFKERWFNISFSLCCAIIGFILLKGSFIAQLFIAAIFFAFGWLISLFTPYFLELFIYNNKVIVIVQIVLCIVLIVGAILLNSNISPSNSNNNDVKRVRCSFCGEKVPEYNMRGEWCKDCQKNAFGEDGWYYDIQD